MNGNKSIHMSSKEFRQYGHSVIDWIADYYDNVEQADESFEGLIKQNKINNVSDFCFKLLEKKSVVSVPGKSFGANHNIRFSYD